MPQNPDRAFERRHPVLPIRTDEVLPDLACLFERGADAEFTHLTGGRVNSNYRVDVPGQCDPVLLRLYARGQATCRIERDVLERVSDHVPVPRVLADGSNADTPFLILSWIEGQTLEAALSAGTADPVQLGAQAGTALAALHTVRFTKAGLFGPDLTIAEPFGTTQQVFTHFALPALEGRAGDRLGSDQQDALRDVIRANLPAIETLQLPTVLVHSDFNPPNLLVDGNSLTGVLDWEFAHAGNPLTDIANMLRPRPHQPDAFNQAFLGAYQQASAPLPDGWEQASRLLDLLSQIEMLDAEDERPVLFKWAVSRIEDTVTFLQSGSHI